MNSAGRPVLGGVGGEARQGMGDAGGDDRLLRREALQIALQLPPDTAEALAILKLAEQLVRGFLAGSDEAPPPPRPSTPLRLV